jgi:AcrR family transcriptional regulator
MAEQRTPLPDDAGQAHANLQRPDQAEGRTGRRARQSREQTREQILAAAHRLFYWEGIRATGIDRVAAEAGVAPVTLYRSFATKDELVEAYVDLNATGYRQWLTDATRPEVGSARQRILAMFDALAQQVEPENCRGCPFLMTLAEFPDPSHPARQRAIEIKDWVRAHIRSLAHDLAMEQPVDDPDTLADQLVLVFEGVYASVQALGVEGPTSRARGAAEALMTAATRAG